MSTNRTYRRKATVSAAALVLFAAAFAPHPSHAATTCTFTTDLTIGTVSDSVKCLQQYLNANGFVVSTSGVGSIGSETTQFQAKTEAAVKMWQTANGITPATGTFGAKSRAKYTALISGATPTAPAPATAPTQSSSATSAQIALQSAMTEYAGAESSVGTKTAGWADLNAARKRIFEAVNALISGNYGVIPALANDATTYSRNAVTAANSSSNSNSNSNSSSSGDEEDAEDAINDVKDNLEDAKDEVDDAYDDGEDTEDADDDLDDAEDLIEEAEDAYDDEDYDDAMDLVDEAQDKIDDALDEIGSSSNGGDKADAKEAIEDAQDNLDDAYDEVDDSGASSSDRNAAEDLLDEAQDLLDDAEDAYDDGDYDDALDLAEEAEDLIDEALDEI